MMQYNQNVTKSYESTRVYDGRPQEQHKPNVRTYESLYNYDDQERYRKNFERDYQSYK